MVIVKTTSVSVRLSLKPGNTLQESGLWSLQKSHQKQQTGVWYRMECYGAFPQMKVTGWQLHDLPNQVHSNLPSAHHWQLQKLLWAELAWPDEMKTKTIHCLLLQLTTFITQHLTENYWEAWMNIVWIWETTFKFHFIFQLRVLFLKYIKLYRSLTHNF